MIDSNKNELKNIIIINDFDYVQGGASKVAIDTANSLAEKNYNVIFFCGISSSLSQLNTKVKKICTNQYEALKDKNRVRGLINGLYNFKSEKIFNNLLKEYDNKNTIIHIHGWSKCLSSSVINAGFKKKFKIVLTMHDYFTACPNGGFFNYPKNEICKLKALSSKCMMCNCDSRNYLYKIYRIIRQLIQKNIVKLNKKIENVISISDFSEKILKPYLPKDKVNIYRVYNPIEIMNVKNDISKNQYYLFVGRLSPEKGVETFCNAISKSKKKGIVVGDGPEMKRLSLKYPEIDFVGWKNKHEVADYMIKAKALIFPSLWYETVGLTLLEANMVGVPGIVRKNIATSEFVQDNVNGFLFSNDEDLIKILKKYDTMSKDTLLNMSRLAKSNAKNYTYQKYIYDLEKCYKNIINS